MFSSSEKHSSSCWYTPSLPHLLHLHIYPQFLFPISLCWLLRCLLSLSVFVVKLFIISMNLSCCANVSFCWSSRCWRNVFCVVVIAAACSFALSSSGSRLLVYSIMVCWSEGDIWLVVMLVRGLDDALLTTVTSLS